MSNRLSIAETIGTGLTPFFRLPLSAPEADAVILGIPFDSGTTYRAGARFGPYGVRKASLTMGQVDSRGAGLFDTLRVIDGGNLVCNPFDIREAQSQIELQAVAHFERKRPVFSVGGDHSATFPLLKAAAQVYGPLAVVHFDAHCDTTAADAWGTPYHHGTVFRNAIEAGCIAPGKFIQIGLRGPFGEIDPHAFTRRFGGEVYEIDAWQAGIGRLGGLAYDWGEHPVYVSIDIDVVDPAYAPGTGTPVAGGITSRELLAAVRALRGLNLIGFDVMEVAPDYDHAEITALLGAHVLFEGLSLLAATREFAGAPFGFNR